MDSIEAEKPHEQSEEKQTAETPPDCLPEKPSTGFTSCKAYNPSNFSGAAVSSQELLKQNEQLQDKVGYQLETSILVPN